MLNTCGSNPSGICDRQSEQPLGNGQRDQRPRRTRPYAWKLSRVRQLCERELACDNWLDGTGLHAHIEEAVDLRVESAC